MIEKVVGIDITTGLPKEQEISLNDILEALNPIIKNIVTNVRFLIEQLPLNL